MSKTLLVLAAGMGSRYGGLKQLDPVGPCGEVILDYSVYDAIRAGFERVVFVIRRDFEDIFRSRVVSRYEGRIRVDVCFQDGTDLPGGRQGPPQRTKPWGTGHAIWSARHAVDGPFLAVNADDFYGPNAFCEMSKFFDSAGTEKAMALVAYRLDKTLSQHGAVSRGVCRVSSGAELEDVEEHTGIERGSDGVVRGVSELGREVTLQASTPVSMNFWGFSPGVFVDLGVLFSEFLDQGGLENPSSEFYIPSAVRALTERGRAPATVLRTPDQWLGVTYREDREPVVQGLRELVSAGVYPPELWNL